MVLKSNNNICLIKIISFLALFLKVYYIFKSIKQKLN